MRTEWTNLRSKEVKKKKDQKSRIRKKNQKREWTNWKMKMMR